NFVDHELERAAIPGRTQTDGPDSPQVELGFVRRHRAQRNDYGVPLTVRKVARDVTGERYRARPVTDVRRRQGERKLTGRTLSVRRARPEADARINARVDRRPAAVEARPREAEAHPARALPVEHDAVAALAPECPHLELDRAAVAIAMSPMLGAPRG